MVEVSGGAEVSGFSVQVSGFRLRNLGIDCILSILKLIERSLGLVGIAAPTPRRAEP